MVGKSGFRQRWRLFSRNTGLHLVYSIRYVPRISRRFSWFTHTEQTPRPFNEKSSSTLIHGRTAKSVQSSRDRTAHIQTLGRERIFQPRRTALRSIGEAGENSRTKAVYNHDAPA